MAWTPAKNDYVLSPSFSLKGFEEQWPEEHSAEAIHRQRRRLLTNSPALYRREEQVPNAEEVLYWDKAQPTFHWTDVLDPLRKMQQIAKAASGSQDFATIKIETDRPLPVCFISDWHVGAWGISYDQVAETTFLLQRLGVRIAILGDFLEMAIRMRSVLEIGGNLLSPRLQDMFQESWLEDMAAYILWSTYDNHSVQRQEELTGFSRYAELFKKSTIYHSGIGHVDLIVGNETYKIATAHKFAGNTKVSPTGGQERYMEREGIDRELTVAGDSHRPAVKSYTQGPLERIAINVGSFHKDSGFAKRFHGLYTHDWMPVVVFMPDEHLMIPYNSLHHYRAAHDAGYLHSVPDCGRDNT